MAKWLKWFIFFDGLVIIGVAAVVFSPIADVRAPVQIAGDALRGQQMLFQAGCYACHTDTAEGDAKAFSGGPKLSTQFGDFYAPNITSSRDYGIGDWNIARFELALRQGVNSDGHAYYPTFPFSSYRSLTDQDVADLFAALKATEAVDQASPNHQISFPYNIRLALKPWRWLFFSNRAVPIDQTTELGRGRYLVDVVGHCGECHNPRNSLGAFIPPYLSGNSNIPGGFGAPPIVGEALLQRDWTEADLSYFLVDGVLPDGDTIGGSMVEVIDFSTSQMTDADRQAIARYLLSLTRR